MIRGRKRREEETIRVSYKLDANIENRLKNYCKVNGLVMGRFIEQAISEKLDKTEREE